MYSCPPRMASRKPSVPWLGGVIRSEVVVVPVVVPTVGLCIDDGSVERRVRSVSVMGDHGSGGPSLSLFLSLVKYLGASIDDDDTGGKKEGRRSCRGDANAARLGAKRLPSFFLLLRPSVILSDCAPLLLLLLLLPAGQSAMAMPRPPATIVVLRNDNDDDVIDVDDADDAKVATDPAAAAAAATMALAIIVDIFIFDCVSCPPEPYSSHDTFDFVFMGPAGVN
mmetsp:Transcript_32566/g.78859  ORF Transcript_32566/g.78859 Transcript_32566/m.78859 type:complete len:224 (+) Transcript_32566:432-1103(+)